MKKACARQRARSSAEPSCSVSTDARFKRGIQLSQWRFCFKSFKAHSNTWRQSV